MIEYTASNGAIIRRTSGGLLALGNYMYLQAAEEVAWREFFQHERDEELGRWRWPDNPDFVVYPSGDRGSSGSRRVNVLDECNGHVTRVLDKYRNGVSADHEAAYAYFEAHPERKPWEDAKTGEIWVLTLDGDESAWSVSNKDVFESPDSTLKPTSSMITAGRRIWPEGDES